MRQRSGVGREGGTGPRVAGASRARRGGRKGRASRSVGALIRAGAARAADTLWGLEAPAAPAGLVDRRARVAALAREHLASLGLYLLIAVAMSWPLALHLGTHLPGDDRDAWQNYWDYWWLRRALAEGRGPYWTPLLYAPFGAPLYLHTLNPFNGLVSLPVQLAFGLTAAYNVVVLLSLTLAAYFASRLVGYVSGSRAAGLAGGVIYGFGSFQMAHLLGHPNLLASGWLPAYVLCLLRALDARGRRRTLWAAAAVGALALAMLCDWQHVLFAAVFTALYVPAVAIARRSLAPLAVAGTIALGWLLVAAPLLLPTVAEIRETAATRPAVLGPERYSADLVSLVVPSPLHPWWGALAERVGGRADAPLVDRAVFLGYLPLLLGAYGVVRRWRRAWPWALVALAGAILALGPMLHALGRTRFGAGGWELPLPYRGLQALPLVGVARVPARFALLTTLCLAVLAGLGLTAIGSRVEGRGSKVGRSEGLGAWGPAGANGVRPVPGARPSTLDPRPSTRAALVALLAGLLVEHLAAPYPLTAVREPAFYRQLAASGEAGTVLELPLALDRSRSLYYQTVHGRPIVGGYLSRPLDYPLLDLPPFDELVGRPRDADITAAPGPGVGARALEYAGVRWIVLLLDDPAFDRAAVAPFLARYTEPGPIYRDERMEVYRPRAPGEPAIYLRVGEGWHALETLAGSGAAMRWLGWSATLDAWGFGAGPEGTLAGTLTFDAWSFAQPRRLVVSVDGGQVWEGLVAEPRCQAVLLALTPGRHQVELRVLDRPERPARLGLGEDTRLISVGVANVDLRPVGGPGEEGCARRP